MNFLDPDGLDPHMNGGQPVGKSTSSSGVIIKSNVTSVSEVITLNPKPIYTTGDFPSPSFPNISGKSDILAIDGKASATNGSAFLGFSGYTFSDTLNIKIGNGGISIQGQGPSAGVQLGASDKGGVTGSNIGFDLGASASLVTLSLDVKLPGGTSIGLALSAGVGFHIASNNGIINADLVKVPLSISYQTGSKPVTNLNSVKPKTCGGN